MPRFNFIRISISIIDRSRCKSDTVISFIFFFLFSFSRRIRSDSIQVGPRVQLNPNVSTMPVENQLELGETRDERA